MLTFSTVFSKEHNADVLDEHHESDEPHDEGHRAQHVVLCRLHCEDGREDIQRRGPCSRQLRLLTDGMFMEQNEVLLGGVEVVKAAPAQGSIIICLLRTAPSEESQD